MITTGTGAVAAQVADLEHELDDAYDDLEPVLRNLECKDDNVRFGPALTSIAPPAVTCNR